MTPLADGRDIPDAAGEFIVAQVSYLAIGFSAIGQDRILGYIVWFPIPPTVAQVSYLAIGFSAIGQDRILGYIVGFQFRQRHRPPEKNALDIENVSNYTVEIGDGIQVSMAVQVKKYLTFFSIKCIMGD